MSVCLAFDLFLLRKKVFLPVLKELIEKYKLFKKQSSFTFIEISKVITCNINYYSKKKVMNQSIYILQSTLRQSLPLLFAWSNFKTEIKN
jgi:hypothetical protein